MMMINKQFMAVACTALVLTAVAPTRAQDQCRFRRSPTPC